MSTFMLSTSSTISSSKVRRSTIFRKYLRPLYLHHWVCGWVFENLSSSPFHNDHILPTTVFQNPLVFSADTRFFQSYISTILHNQCEAHEAFIPVYTKDNITVGYAFCFSSDFKRRHNLSNELPFCPPYIARFVLDHNSHNLTIYIPCPARFKMFAIHGFTLSSPIQHTFVIPEEDYNWTNLPNHPTLFFEGHATSPYINGTNPSFLNTISSNFQVQQLNADDLTHKDIDTLMSKMSISSTHQPTHQPSSNSVSNSNPIVPNRVNTSSVMTISELNSHHTQLSTAILPINSNSLNSISCVLSTEHQLSFQTEMINMWHNRFCSMGINTDWDSKQLPGIDSILQLPSLHHIMRLSDQRISRIVTPKCADVYYSIILSVTADGPLLRQPQVSKDQLTLKETEKDSEYYQRNQPLKSQSKEIILQKRRMRNRLSATRSNAKRQQKFENLEKELESSKHLVEILREKEDTVLHLNQQLKLLVGASQM